MAGEDAQQLGAGVARASDDSNLQHSITPKSWVRGP
jgi:hypothetical protein